MSVVSCITPCLDIDVGRVVKDVNLEDPRDAGDPVELVSHYSTKGTDEITFLDVSASSQERAVMPDVVAEITEEVLVPLTVGGGIRSAEGVACFLAHGADKVNINTAAITDLDLISRVADCFGDQVLVLSVGVHRCPEGVTTASGFEVATHSGKRFTGVGALERALKAASPGAGEILLNSTDAGRVRTGFDLKILNAFRSEITIPLIASGGADISEHFLGAARTGVDAFLAASVFHFREVAISDVRSALHTQRSKVRI